MQRCLDAAHATRLRPADQRAWCAGMQFDWDDAAGDAKRRAAGLRLEAMRKAEEKRLRQENRGKTCVPLHAAR